MGHVVVDADGEMILGLIFAEFIEHRLDHRRGEFLGRQPVAAANHSWHGRHWQRTRAMRFHQGADHTEIHRLAGGTRLLGAVENGNGFNRGGQRRQESVGGKRQEQPDLQYADFLAALVEVSGSFASSLGARSHQDHDTLGVRIAGIVEQVVAAASQFGELVHRRLDDSRHLEVVRIAGFAALKVGVGILRGAANEWPIRIQSTSAMRQHQIVADHGADVVIGEHGELVDFMRSAEAIEEMDERQPRFQGRGMGDQRHVVGFLHRVGGQQAEAGRPHRHHILMIAENGQALGRQRASGDVEHR